MSTVPVDLRDQLITEFRWRVCDKLQWTPLPHQADWWAATNGKVLTDEHSDDPSEECYNVRWGMEDGQIHRRRVIDRPHGRARVIGDLGAFKSGKSRGAAMWAAAFACIPDARVQLVGLEYDICSPEFEYIVEALLSESGLGLKYSSLQNRPRDGRMHLDLPNGARFEARSWERKDSLKGKEIDCYLICEAYQLPGLEVYTDYNQNLQKRKGYWIAATTPDRPWVQAIHERGHQHPEFDDWHCTCGVERQENPFTFDQTAMDRDNPEKGGLMTKEKFAIAYKGKLGSYVGRVYNYQRGQRVFTRGSHPHMWNPETKTSTLNDLKLPSSWEIVGGADTGSFTCAVLVAFDHDGTAFVLAEFPNYIYMADGKPDIIESSSIPQWARWVLTTRSKFDTGSSFWADNNSQWKHELSHYGIHLMGNATTRETRTSVAREYFQSDKIFFAPWLSVVPFEIENARWPVEATSGGKFERMKDRDHALDPIEHVLSKRPISHVQPSTQYGTFLEEYAAANGLKRRGNRDPHLT